MWRRNLKSRGDGIVTWRALEGMGSQPYSCLSQENAGSSSMFTAVSGTYIPHTGPLTDQYHPGR